MKIFEFLKEQLNENIFIEIRGDKLMHIDGAERLLVYENEIITISGKDRNVIIRGSGLSLDYLSEKKVAVKGKIKSVEFSEGSNV